MALPHVSSSVVPALFPALPCQPWMLKYQLAFLSYRYVETAAITCGSRASTVCPYFLRSSVAPFPCFQRCFSSIVSHVISSSALNATSSLSSVEGTLRLLTFCVYLQLFFFWLPRLLLGLPGSVDRGVPSPLSLEPVV